MTAGASVGEKPLWFPWPCALDELAQHGEPGVFAVIGEALPKEQRAMGFTLQSMHKRVPMAFTPLAGGALIAWAKVIQ